MSIQSKDSYQVHQNAALQVFQYKGPYVHNSGCENLGVCGGLFFLFKMFSPFLCADGKPKLFY